MLLVEKVRALGVWYQENNLSLTVNKTKEMIVDFREHSPLHVDETAVEKVESSLAYTSQKH